ncbi:MAG: MFS transporter [Anaerolineae bacterium]|nr:MFS transporter [Anaerolineae bacterium]
MTTQTNTKPSCTNTNKQHTLLALMLPQLMVVANMTMINVALPAIRENFDAPADLMAWVVTMYSLPYVALMPLYGRLGDDLGIRRMLVVGAVLFFVGTAVNLLSHSLPLLLLGRFVQGLGASGVVPLAIAMICRVFSVETRGHALGQWNSIGPVASVASSLIGGVIVDHLGWRATFAVPMLAGIVAIYMVSRAVPGSERPRQLDTLRGMDWIGVLLLSATLVALLFYINSRAVTGRLPLTDWRLLLATLVLLVTFVWHEHRVEAPFIDLSILAEGRFRKASIASALRMVVMSGFAFLTPLFLADVKGLNATAIGLVVMIRAAALFPTMYFGGRVADRWGSRRPIVLGLSVMAASVLLVVFSGSGSGVVRVAVGLLLNGLGAGLALPALHHAAMMDDTNGDRGGAAAGLYSMIRFWGSMLGTALSGVLLQFLLDRGTSTPTSYRIVFAYTIGVALLGLVIAISLPRDPIAQE